MSSSSPVSIKRGGIYCVSVYYRDSTSMAFQLVLEIIGESRISSHKSDEWKKRSERLWVMYTHMSWHATRNTSHICTDIMMR